mmetsp:Transcript_20766/g.37812  ORF Transcript_20766/g.37812 Transcript_20766/m.37812 type:complete len:525 (-) Transcript_20766:116-1690(-)
MATADMFVRQTSDPIFDAAGRNASMGHEGAHFADDFQAVRQMDPVRRKFVTSLKSAGLLSGDPLRRHQAKELYAYPDVAALAMVAKKREVFHEIMGSDYGSPQFGPASGLTKIPLSPTSATTSLGPDSPVPSPMQSPDGMLDVPPDMTEAHLESFELLPPPQRCTDAERTDMLWLLAESGQPSIKPLDESPEVESDGQKHAVYLLESDRVADRPFHTIFKPLDGEDFARRGIEVGLGALREEAAYVIDRAAGGQAHVPVTTRASFDEKGIRKRGSVQLFVEESCGPVENFGMPMDLSLACQVIALDEAQAIACFDIRVFNTDRHPGNLLLAGKRPHKVVCIDHGCALPAWWALECAQFDAWMEWPHVKAPATKATCELVEEVVRTLPSLLQDLDKLELPKQAAWTLRICCALLQHGVLTHGLSLHQIAKLMVRKDPGVPSWLERQVEDACEAGGEFAEFRPEGKYNDLAFHVEDTLVRQFEMWDDALVTKHMRTFEHMFFDHLQNVFSGASLQSAALEGGNEDE